MSAGPGETSDMICIRTRVNLHNELILYAQQSPCIVASSVPAVIPKKRKFSNVSSLGSVDSSLDDAVSFSQKAAAHGGRPVVPPATRNSRTPESEMSLEYANEG